MPSIEIEAKVNVVAEVFDVETGALLDRQETHNKAVGDGLNMIRDLLYGDTVPGISHIAFGTGNTAVQDSDHALGAEVFRDALNARVKGQASLVMQYYLGSMSANGQTLREAGLFNASSGGMPYARVVLGNEIAKTPSIAIAFTWTLTWGAA